jgi:uncharacterized membrane protein YhaH (DUF805 family)
MENANKKEVLDKISLSNVLNETGQSPELFGRNNYLWMIVGIALIMLGMIMMAGGKSPMNKFNEAEVYSSTRIVIAPILIIAGIVVEFYAIMSRRK